MEKEISRRSMEKESEIKLAPLRNIAIITRMNADCAIKMTEKEIDNLKAWKRWGALMKMLRAIHREIEPRKQERRSAFDSL